MDDHLAVVAELDMDRYVKPPLAHAQFAVLIFPSLSTHIQLPQRRKRVLRARV